jgi:phosphodiesterase/alkaline phosphatase D-like protein
MARCNTGKDSVVVVSYYKRIDEQGGGDRLLSYKKTLTAGNATSRTDYTLSLKLENLQYGTQYKYQVKCVPSNGDATAAKSSVLHRQAFFEHNPIMGDIIYRSHNFGKHLEVFLIDMRSYRSTNPSNESPNLVAMLGSKQAQWLMDASKSSTATWKITACTIPSAS